MLDAGNGPPARRENVGEANRVRQDVDRKMASSALRRLLLAASACDGAAGAAATAADEIAQLRADIHRGTAREEQKARLASYKNWDGTKERSPYLRAAMEEQNRQNQIVDTKLEQFKQKRRAEKRQEANQEAQIREASRREAAGKANELAEELAVAKSQLAAAKRVAEEELEARALAVQETERLGKRLRKTEAEAAAASEDAAVWRADEAATSKRLRDEISAERSRATSESQQAAEAMKAAREEAASHAEAARENARAAKLAHEARNAEASESSALRAHLEARLEQADILLQQELAAERARSEDRAEAKLAEAFEGHRVAAAEASSEARRASAAEAARAADANAAAEALANARRWGAEQEARAKSVAGDAVVVQALQALLVRREEAARRVLSSVMASRIDTLVRGVFSAWRDSEALQRQLFHERERSATLEARESNNLSSAAQLHRDLELERGEVVRLRAEVDSTRRRAAEEVNAASAASSEAEARVGLAARSTALMLARRVESCRHVLASLLASQMEISVRGAFGAWRLSVEQVSSEAAITRELSSAHEAELSEHRRKGERLTKDLADAVAQLERLRDRSAQQDQAEEMLAQEALVQARAASQAQATASEAAMAARMSLAEGEAAAQAAAEAAEERAEQAFRSEAAARAEAITVQHKADLEAANNEVARLRRDLERATADAAAAHRSAADAESSARELRQVSSVAATGDILKEEARAALALRREAVCRSMFATMLASHLELQLRGTFVAWRAALVDSGVSEEKLSASLLAERAAREQAAATSRELSAEVAAAAELRQRLRDTAAAEARAAEEAARSREADALEVAATAREVQRLREELERVATEADSSREVDLVPRVHEQAVHSLLMRREEVSRRVVATLLASHLECNVRGVFCAWRAACEKDGSEEELARLQKALQSEISDLEDRNEALRNELSNVLAAKMDAEAALEQALARDQAEGVNGTSARAVEIPSDVMTQLARMTLVLRREESSRKLVSSLLAAQMEHLVRGVLTTWYDATIGERHMPSADKLRELGEEVTKLREELRYEKTKAVAAVGGAEAARDLHQHASLAVVLHAMSAARGVLASMLARNLEALVCGTFSAWADVVAAHHRQCEKKAFSAWAKIRRISKEVLLKDAFQEWRHVTCVMSKASMDRGIGISSGEVSELRELFQRAEGEAEETRAKLKEADEQHERDMEVLKARLQKAEEAQRAAELTAEKAKQQALQVMDDDHEKVQALERQVQDLMARLESAEGRATLAVSEAVPRTALYARREAATRGVLSTLLASQLETLVCGVFHAWRLAGQLQPQPAQDRSVTVQDRSVTDEVMAAREQARAAAHLAQEVSAAARLISKREDSTRRMLARSLAMQLEVVVRGAFVVWRDLEKAKPVRKLVGKRHDGQAVRLRSLERHVRVKERQHGEHHPEVAHALLAVAHFHGRSAAAAAGGARQAEVTHLERATSILQRHDDKAAADSAEMLSGARSRLDNLRSELPFVAHTLSAIGSRYLSPAAPHIHAPAGIGDLAARLEDDRPQHATATRELKGKDGASADDLPEHGSAIDEFRGDEAASGVQPLEVKCRSCGNTGRDLAGEFCVCAHGQRMIVEAGASSEPSPAPSEPSPKAADQPEPPTPGSSKAIDRSPSAEWYEEDFDVDSEPEL